MVSVLLMLCRLVLTLVLLRLMLAITMLGQAIISVSTVSWALVLLISAHVSFANVIFLCVFCFARSFLPRVSVLDFWYAAIVSVSFMPSVLWHCRLRIRRSIQPVKSWETRCWCGYQSGARCRLSWCHSIPKPITSCLSLNLDWFYLSGTGLPRWSWKRGR